MWRRRRRAVDDLVQREQAEVAGRDLGRPATGRDRGADTGADEAVLGQRRVDVRSGPGLLEQAPADRVAAAVAALLAEQTRGSEFSASPGSPARPFAVADLLASRLVWMEWTPAEPTGSRRRDWW